MKSYNLELTQEQLALMNSLIDNEIQKLQDDVQSEQDQEELDNIFDIYDKLCELSKEAEQFTIKYIKESE